MDPRKDSVQQVFYSALQACGYPVSQPPADAEMETYIAFNEVSARASGASNMATRVHHLVQVHAYSHSQDDEHRKAFFAALHALQERGVKVWSWGPDDYDRDTGMHHIACTCAWIERVEKEEKQEEQEKED